MNARKVSYLGVLVALAVSLNVLESMIPTPLPWVRLGLANLLALVAILTSGWKEGLLVTVLRILISSLLFGGFLSPAFLLSLGGGLAGTAVMALMAPGVWRFYSPLSMSVAGAFAHGTVQVLVLRLVLVRTWEVLYLLPWVLFPALLSGVVTGVLANLLLLRRRELFELLSGKMEATGA
jgi:heptaprenyl diphosphate synthase